jgi:hypothetical protein
MEDDGMIHHAIYNGGGNDGVFGIIAKVLEVCSEQGRAFAVTAVDDLEEQRCVFCVLLFEPVCTKIRWDSEHEDSPQRLVSDSAQSYKDGNKGNKVN